MSSDTSMRAAGSQQFDRVRPAHIEQSVSKLACASLQLVQVQFLGFEIGCREHKLHILIDRQIFNKSHGRMTFNLLIVCV